MPQLTTRQRHDIITTVVLGFIGLAYEGISSFLHNRRHKALHRAVKAMNSKTTIQHNKLMYLEDSMVMYGIYNAETLGKLINTVHHIHNFTSQYEKLFVVQQDTALLQLIYTNMEGIQHYCIKSLLYLRIVKEKYVSIYKEFIMQLCIYASAIRILAKGFLPISLITPLKLKEILNTVRNTVRKTNPDYDLAIKRPYLYYDMKLVTFSVDIDKNLIIQCTFYMIIKGTRQPVKVHFLLCNPNFIDNRIIAISV